MKRMHETDAELVVSSFTTHTMAVTLYIPEELTSDDVIVVQLNIYPDGGDRIRRKVIKRITLPYREVLKLTSEFIIE